MRGLSAMNWLINPFLITILSLSTLAAADSTATIYAWPLSAPSPTPLATIAISSSQSPPTASVQSVNLPSLSPSAEDLVRVGLYHPSTHQWTGTATSASSFAQGLGRKITLRTNDDGEVYHVSLNAYKLPGKSKKKDVLEVEVLPRTEGPKPVLNKPVVLDAEGKVPQGKEEDTKTFLQKWWWVLALLLVMQLVAGGSPKE